MARIKDLSEHLRGKVRQELEAGESYRSLAERTGVIHGTLFRFVTDGIDLRLSTVKKLCEIYGVEHHEKKRA